ncbi:hypothetical protein Z517_06469 [Fonsecaea pedrosoi CBS 271.37]|uniref:Heterokaryon incompatibility domain-containing protein n=1 Tax=Fonsecaea pedrosoi CBS 271.37 TaxID=1442368 RepID=A0A0D2H598_9EURO|nr:uncharacterized protein Z517_06469 [Fonsecaea pedrosoi CBS 271.37]KIW79854.1 hypothetical protein Z517_06469 [Fonsecaea pedrosoi CBS 271.37]
MKAAQRLSQNAATTEAKNIYPLASTTAMLSVSLVKYVYQSLSPSADYIRLAKVEAAPNVDDPIRCNLIQVEFGQRPRYRALSYTWGDEKVKNTIHVDGKELEIGTNLSEALRSLRVDGYDSYLWADAICIDQENIPERNRQLKIMPHIYNRAETVCVWLGANPAAQIQDASQHQSELDEKSLLALCRHPYWQRAWIVQELGKARKIQICFNQNRLSWDDFIKRINHRSWSSWWRGDEHDTSGPSSLHEQLQSKFVEGHTFVDLLKRHQNAQCKDPRDKVYAFVGLAIDSYGFPMDYSKSLYEVWEDTIDFVTSNGMVDSHDILSFSKLVKRLLGWKEIEASSNRPRRYPLVSPGFSTSEGGNPDTKIPTSTAGMIIDIGPSIYQLIADLNAADSWAARLHQNFNKDPGPASKANEEFMNQLQTLSESDLQGVLAFDPSIRWEASSSTPIDILQYTRDCKIVPSPVQVPKDSNSNGPAYADYKAFLYRSDKYPGTIWGRVGIGPAQMRVGDFIYCVRNLDKAIIARISRQDDLPEHMLLSERDEVERLTHNFEIVGTALLSVGLSDPDRYNVVAWCADDGFDLEMDAKTISDLISNCTASDLLDGNWFYGRAM